MLLLLSITKVINPIKQIYHKRQLVPLAEHFPFSENFNFLKNINIGQANFSKGKEDIIFNLGEYNFASLVCFESTFPEINRRHANLGIDALIYLVNDGSNLKADKVDYDFTKKLYKVSMYQDDKVKVKFVNE